MNESYNIYCVSNANNFEDNNLTCFKNFLPQNLDLKNKEWEIGIVKFGFQFNTEKIEDLSIVSILTDVVIDSPNGNKYSTLIYDTSLLTSTKEKYFNHYVKHIKYFPIRNTFIDSIKTQFVDINGKQLIIEKGEPSFIHYHLRTKQTKENYKMNYIRLDSGITKMEPWNTNNNFLVHLKDSIELNENSEVALVNINFPNSIRNINKSLSQKHIDILIKKGDNITKHQFNIPAGHYPSAASLVKAFNLNLPAELLTNLQVFNANGKLKFISLFEDRKIIFKFPMEYKNIFGLEVKLNSIKIKDNKFLLQLKKKSFVIVPNPINLFDNYPSIMLCHANFIKHSIVGNTYFPILKIIPIGSLSKDKYISVDFEHLEFIKLNVEYLKNLHFQLKHLNGDFVEFADNKKIILNLVVKKM